MKAWFQRLFRNLGFWSLHGVLSALPGFCIAMGLIRLSQNPAAFPAMLSALLTVIFLMACITLFWPSLTGWRTLPSRGLRVGLTLRAICASASFMVILAVLATNGRDGNPILFLLPDLWTGLGAVLSIAFACDHLGLGNPMSGIMDGYPELSFAMIYLIAFINGLILCFLIFIVSFVSMLILQIRDRRRLYRDWDAGMIPADDRSGMRRDPG